MDPFGMVTSSPVSAGQYLPGIPDEPFRFLDLPLDIRFIIYEKIITRTWVTLNGDRSPDSSTEPVPALVVPDPIPPIHLTCRSLLVEAVSILKPLVLRSRIHSNIPRIVYWGGKAAGSHWDEEPGRLLLSIDWILFTRDSPATQEAVHEYLEVCTPYTKKDVTAIQKFVENFLKHHPTDRHSVLHLAEPIEVVQVHVPDDQGQILENRGFWRSFGTHLSIKTYSVKDQTIPSDDARNTWFKYGGVVSKKAWDADWA